MDNFLEIKSEKRRKKKRITEIFETRAKNTMERFNFVARILHPRTSEFLNRISTVLGSRIRPSNIVFYVGRVHILEAFTPQGVDEGEKRVRERIRKERERETIQDERCAPRRALALLRIQECCRVSYFRHPSFPYSRQQVT